MARILIVVYGSLGDLHPAIALGLGLKAAGHETAIATSEPYREKITSAGLAFHPVRPDLSLGDEALVRIVMDGVRGSERLLRDLVLPTIREMHADLVPLAANADLIVAGELGFAASIVAEQHRIPWAYFSLSPITFLPVHDPSIIPGPPILHFVQSLGPAANRFVLWLAKIVSRSWTRPVRELRRDLGLPIGRSPLFEGKFSPHLNLALFSPALQPPQPDWPTHTTQAGFVFHDETHSAPALPPPVDRFLADGEPPIVFTLGSSAVLLAKDFYPHSAEAARKLGRRAILLHGRNPPPPDLPSSVLAWNYLPYATIFPRAAAIVHQGGVGTTAQALRAGKPMLVMPFAHDQFDNAARVCRLGVARRIAREHYDADSAARELGVLLENLPVFSQAAALGAHIRKERGLERACEAIERVVKT